MAYSTEAGPTKYLVGTEQGVVLALNKKPKKAVETGTWFGLDTKGGQSPHHGPVYRVRAGAGEDGALRLCPGVSSSAWRCRE